MRDGDRENCLRVLGIGPGASSEEIKAAYRDLAKVWHPDRFAHDSRLQQKAQEQLKEINAAYARLTSGDQATTNARPPRAPSAGHASRAPDDAGTARSPRPDTAHDTRREARAESTADVRVAMRPRRKVSRLALAAPTLAFCATFAFVTPRLLTTSRAPEQTGTTPAVERAPSPDEQDDAAQQQTNPAARAARAPQKTPNSVQPQATRDAEFAPAAAAARPPLPTVTVSIDPTTGLRARAACPHKTSMTFPEGDEPGSYCDAAHGNAGRDNAAASRGATDEARAGGAGSSRLKSFAGRVAAPARKLFGGRRAPDKGPTDKVADAPRN